MPFTRPFWRRLRLGLSTLLGSASRGYFIPYRYAGEIPPSSARQGFPKIEALFKAEESRFLDLLEDEALIAGLARRFDQAVPPEPRWQQNWFPRLDGLAAYLMIRRHRPKRIVEIGSGHSTRFAAAAIRDGGLTTRLTAIDPAPRADIAALPGITLHQTTIQNAPTDLFNALEAGDMVMIDSSHIAVPGSDVDLLLGRVLPGLPVGILVQIHDIFLPDPYPESWTWRGYNEQLPVSLLLSGGVWRPLWSSHWIASRHSDRLKQGALSAIPLPEGAHESALWLERCD